MQQKESGGSVSCGDVCADPVGEAAEPKPHLPAPGAGSECRLWLCRGSKDEPLPWSQPCQAPTQGQELLHHPAPAKGGSWGFYPKIPVCCTYSSSNTQHMGFSSPGAVSLTNNPNLTPGTQHDPAETANVPDKSMGQPQPQRRWMRVFPTPRQGRVCGRASEPSTHAFLCQSC